MNRSLLCVFSLAAALIPVLASSGLDDAYRFYKKAEARLEAGALDDALRFVDLALDRSQTSGAFRVGIQSRNYYPHYLRGLIQLRRGDARAAQADFETELAKSEIQKDTKMLARLRNALQEAESIDTEPPVVRVEDVSIAEFLTVEGEGRQIEQVRVRLQGFAVDSQSGIRSMKVADREVALTSDEGTHHFDEIVTVGADRRRVEIVAVDSAGNVGTTEHALSVPPLDLGDRASGIHAVIVGVNEYDKSDRTEMGDCRTEIRGSCAAAEQFACYSIPDLSYAADDAENLHDLLLRRGVPRENLHLLTSRNGDLRATRANILAALKKLEDAVGDRAIFFFSGHGISSKRQENLMLVSDTQGWECGSLSGRESTAIEKTALGVNEVARAMMRSPIKQRYIILDACRSPRLATKGSEAQKPSPGFSIAGTKGIGLVTVTEPEDHGWDPIVFYSTLERKVSVEWNKKSSGYFTYYLLQGLRRDLPLDRLKRFVQSNVKRQTLEDLCSAELSRESCPYAQAPYLQMPEMLENDYELQSATFILGSANE